MASSAHQRVASIGAHLRSSPAEQIHVTPVGTSFGAEVRGIDLSRPLSKPDLETVTELFLKHKVLFFRGQTTVTTERQVACGLLATDRALGRVTAFVRTFGSRLPVLVAPAVHLCHLGAHPGARLSASKPGLDARTQRALGHRAAQRAAEAEQQGRDLRAPVAQKKGMENVW